MQSGRLEQVPFNKDYVAANQVMSVIVSQKELWTDNEAGENAYLLWTVGIW